MLFILESEASDFAFAWSKIASRFGRVRDEIPCKYGGDYTRETFEEEEGSPGLDWTVPAQFNNDPSQTARKARCKRGSRDLETNTICEL